MKEDTLESFVSSVDLNDKGFCQESRRVHWAEELSKTLPFIRDSQRSDSSFSRLSDNGDNSVSSDSFQTCCSDVEDRTLETTGNCNSNHTVTNNTQKLNNSRCKRSIDADQMSHFKNFLNNSENQDIVGNETPKTADLNMSKDTKQKIRCQRNVLEWLNKNPLSPSSGAQLTSAPKHKPEYMSKSSTTVPSNTVHATSNMQSSLSQDSRWLPPKYPVLPCDTSDLITSDESYEERVKPGSKNTIPFYMEGSTLKNDISDLMSSIDLSDTIENVHNQPVFDSGEYVHNQPVFDSGEKDGRLSGDFDSCSESNVLNKSFEESYHRRSIESAYSDCPSVDYIYRDPEKGIVLIERHIPSKCSSNCGSKRSSLDSTQNTILTEDSQKTDIYDWKSLSKVKHVTENNKYKVPKHGSVTTRASLDSIASVSSTDSQVTEDYSVQDYTDHKHTKVQDDQTFPCVPQTLSQLSNEEIREKLQSLGDVPGPVTDNTRQTYLVRLTKAEKDPELIQYRLALQLNIGKYWMIL